MVLSGVLTVRPPGKQRFTEKLWFNILVCYAGSNANPYINSFATNPRTSAGI